MSRLTKKGTYEPIIDNDNIEKKLGQLEDLEEELGIDLIALFKALKQKTIWFNKYVGGGKRNIVEIEHRGLNINRYTNEITITDSNGGLHILGSYGKTWALTKEELEK